MKTTSNYKSIALFIFILLFVNCSEDEDFKICVNRCSTPTPWKVESLDTGLPCFETQAECTKWAAAHFYNKPCVKCD